MNIIIIIFPNFGALSRAQYWSYSSHIYRTWSSDGESAIVQSRCAQKFGVRSYWCSDLVSFSVFHWFFCLWQWILERTMHGLQSFLRGAEIMGGTCTGSNGGAIAILCADLCVLEFGDILWYSHLWEMDISRSRNELTFWDFLTLTMLLSFLAK